MSVTGVCLTLTLTLTLGLVSALKCPVGRWGSFFDYSEEGPCSKLCHCRYDSPCDIDTGECFAGCARDWKKEPKGVECNVRICPVGTFGPPACQGKCHCEDVDACSAIDGQCVGDTCQAGYWGLNCQENTETCKQCNITDVHCVPCSMESCFCKDPECDLPRDKCRHNTDCPLGFKGPECTDRACPQGFFGPPSCNDTCQCQDVHSCSPVDGMCPEGECKEGWSGETCSVRVCPVLKFGYPACEKRCFCKPKFKGKAGTSCDDVTGACPNTGCLDGWNGTACNVRRCPDGFYGPPDCAEKCHCKDNSGCNPLNGMCLLSECQDGWMDVFCDNPIKADYTVAEKEKMEDDSHKGEIVFACTSAALVLVVVAAAVYNYVKVGKGRQQGEGEQRDDIEMQEALVDDDDGHEPAKDQKPKKNVKSKD